MDMSKHRLERILIIKGFSGYSALGVFADSLKAGFDKKGIFCEILDANRYVRGDKFLSRELVPVLTDEIAKEPDAIISFGGILLNNLKYCMRKLKNHIPVIAYYFDHPFWEHDRLLQTLPQYYTVFVDETFTAYASQYYQESKPLDTVHQAGIISPYYKRDFRDRKKSIVFFGSFMDSRSIYNEVLGQNDSTGFLVLKMLEYGKIHTNETIETIALNTFAENGIQVPENKVAGILSNLGMVESYLRSFFRNRCVQIFVEHGLEMDVYGEGWENLEVQNKELLHTHPPVDYREMADIMTEYQYALNVLPWAKAGFHDRLATAMLNGCVCITDTSQYLEKERLDQEKLLTYRLSEEEKIAKVIKDIMRHEERAEHMANAGREYAKANHTWDHRAEQMAERIEKIL